jgi:hypothetical protein
MAYGKRYLLQQALRDDSKLLVNIYKDGYSGSVYNYEAVSVSLSPNSNSDEPEPGIISSQLNVSFLMSSATDNSNFPDLLTYDDKLYYVEVTRIASTGGEVVVWRGYTFNDYVTVPFSTGTTQVDIICIDALSFMKNSYYPYTASSNGLENLYTVLAQGLNSIGYPNSPSLYQCCSYFGSSMANRGASAANEPFSQTYIYKRDLQQKNYYDLIEQIVKSFGCRLFQYKGDWWIMSANEMAASTIYYTKYDLSTGSSTGGTLSNNVTIEPYSYGNIHFVNNSQTKITRKGYPVIKVNAPVKFTSDYIANGTFKINSGGVISNWTQAVTNATITLIPYPSESYDVVALAVNSFGGGATFSYVTAGTLPYFNAPGFSLSFDALKTGVAGSLIEISVENSIGQRFYADSSGVWGAPGVVRYYNIDYSATDNVWQTITYNLQLGAFNISGTNYNVEGYLRIKIDFVSAGYNATLYLRNVRSSQSGTALPSSLLVTRYITTTSSLTKDLESSFGIYRGDIANCYGALFYSSGSPITSWYRYSHIGTTYASLPILVARELSNLFNRNYATLEGDLGKTFDSNGLIYLSNTYTVTDSGSSALTYSGKKFLLNRMSAIPYIDQSTSIQLLEITDTDNASTQSISWVLNT